MFSSKQIILCQILGSKFTLALERKKDSLLSKRSFFPEFQVINETSYLYTKVAYLKRTESGVTLTFGELSPTKVKR